MSTEELKKEFPVEELQFQQKEQMPNHDELLQKSLKGLEQFGGFQLLKGMVKGLENMDPYRKAVKEIFLSDGAYKEMRNQLQSVLSRWVEILEGAEKDRMAIIDSCKAMSKRAEINLNANLKIVHEKVKSLETAYRCLNDFFANAGQGKINCLTLMNINKAELSDNTSADTKAIRRELEINYDRLELNGSYSLLVLPGFLETPQTIRMWAKTAHKNKVVMVTDFMDIPEFDMLETKLDNASLTGKDTYLSNVVMTANYILGRKKSELAGEEEDLFIPASGALAGRMANTEETEISQGASGKKYGTLDNVEGARMDLLKSEIAALINQGVVPIVESAGRTMAYSNHTLYSGATNGLREYSIVRVFDWIGKVLEQYASDNYGVNWDTDTKQSMTADVHAFLSSCKSPEERLIESYKNLQIERDKNKNIRINVELTPFQAMENFYIELSGRNNGSDYDFDLTIDTKTA